MSDAKRSRAIGVALCVVLGFAAIVYLMIQMPGNASRLWTSPNSYQLTARFADIGDLQAGAPVTMAGVRVGRVARIVVDLRLSNAVVTMSIGNRYADIPEDSSISVNSVSLLGGKFLSLDPGGSSTNLRNGSNIQSTRSAVELETVITDVVKSLGK